MGEDEKLWQFEKKICNYVTKKITILTREGVNRKTSWGLHNKPLKKETQRLSKHIGEGNLTGKQDMEINNEKIIYQNFFINGNT